jgi:transketolase
VFSDYSRNALRLSALMGLGTIQVFTHDSIGLGEDGPTHQPIEHAASLRLIPGMDVWRPCDALETAVAWRAAVERRNGPTSLLLSRQNLPPQDGGEGRATEAARGGYVLSEPDGGSPDIVLIATGSEVPLAVAARDLLAGEGVHARVVSMPSTTVFDRQNAAYRKTVLGTDAPRIAIEAGRTDGWWKYVGSNGEVIGIDRFGESAPADALYRFFDLTPDRIAKAAHALL